MNTKTRTPSQSLLPSGLSPSKSDEATPLPASLTSSNVPKPKRKTWQEVLQTKFRYDPETGKLYHSLTTRAKGSLLNGKEIKCKSEGYTVVNLSGREYVHRIIWEMHYGSIPKGMEVDHINHRRADNRLENLRLVSRQDNGRNMSKSKANKSGLPGVEPRARANGDPFWLVSLSKNYIAQVDDFFEACCLRKSAEHKYNFHPNHGKSLT
jgi:hypothetical protein